MSATSQPHRLNCKLLRLVLLAAMPCVVLSCLGVGGLKIRRAFQQFEEA